MKRLITLMMLATALSAVKAQHMMIDKGTDSPEIIELDKLDKITFNGTAVSVRLTDGHTSSGSMGEIKRISFGDFTSVENITEEKKIIEHISCNAIGLSCNAGTIITIYDIIGTQVAKTELDADNGFIGISHLPKGIYILKAGNRTAKFIKR